MFSACAALGLVLSACTEPEPRSFVYFMEDKIAREGTLVRCESNPVEARNDIECANARRAEATLALRMERERLAELEAESARRIEELSRRIAEREELVRAAAREAIRADREATEDYLRQRMQLADPGHDSGSALESGPELGQPMPANANANANVAEPAASGADVAANVDAEPGVGAASGAGFAHDGEAASGAARAEPFNDAEADLGISPPPDSGR